MLAIVNHHICILRAKHSVVISKVYSVNEEMDE